MRVEESTDGVDPLGFGNVSPKSPGELQKTFGSENEGHGATARSGTGPGEGMGEKQAAPSGCDGGLGEKSGGGAGSAVTSTAQMEMEVDPMEGIDDFLIQMVKTASEDSARTVVLNAPRALVCEDNDFLRVARSHYVRNVLNHKDIGVGYDAVESEFVMPMPGRYVGGNARAGGHAVEIGFLHVVLKTASLAKTVIERFNKCCPKSTGGLDMEWGSEKHSARIVTVDNVAWVMGTDALEWRDVELTQNPVWRVVLSHIGIAPSQVAMVHKWGGFAVTRLNSKLHQWGVDGELRHVATRPVYSKDSKVAKGLVLTVEVLREPWVVPKGVSLKEGGLVVSLLWIVAGVQRHPWDGGPPVRHPAQAPARRPPLGGGAMVRVARILARAAQATPKARVARRAREARVARMAREARLEACRPRL